MFLPPWSRGVKWKEPEHKYETKKFLSRKYNTQNYVNEILLPLHISDREISITNNIFVLKPMVQTNTSRRLRPIQNWQINDGISIPDDSYIYSLI